MSYPLHTYAILSYIESHAKDQKLDYHALELKAGFSYAHIRDFFKRDTGYSLASYVRRRKILTSAFELLHTDKTIMELALDYGFSNHESYTRAFTKVVGMTPSAFRNSRPLMGKSELTNGIYGIGLLRQKEKRSDVTMNQKEKYQNNESTVLYGVPKIEWGTYGGSTPYPICLKACADYLGDDLDYATTLVSCGGAFRFTWNEAYWDLSNVDIYHTFTEGAEETVYSYAAKALGREFSMLDRTEATTKEEFISFIKQHIDEGYPCIAQGIIGPPEACIITGYRDNGNTLLGWNFFQNDPAFGAEVTFDDCGYFICSNWWENTDTQSVMCLGPVIGEAHSTKEILKNAVTVMTPRKDGDYQKGIAGFSAWAEMLSDDKACSIDNDSIRFEHMLCEDDATTCLIDGRGCVAEYFKKLVESEAGNVDIKTLEKYRTLAELFSKTKALAEQTWSLLGGWDNMEQRPAKLAEKEVREKACEYIKQIEVLEKQSLEMLQKLV
ncbi:MAG: helix-turn-helix transcriptional regulator [Lachnospiraceae bacterium]|nr:helix-turn-helix transcriptional regulator [Lachnospiraceae bacterium]